MDPETTRLRVLRLGRSYGLETTETDWSKSILMRDFQGWCISLHVGSTSASAVLKLGDGADFVEYAWGDQPFPRGFTYDNFEIVVEMAARATGHTRRILELVQ